MRRSALLFLVVTFVLTPFVLTGCGSVSVDGSAVAKAATKTGKVSGAHFDADVALTIGSQGPIHLAMTGDENMAAHTMHANLDMSDVAQLAGGGAGNPAQWKGELVADFSHGFVEYLRLPAFTRLLPEGKTWVEIDVGKLAQQRGVDLSQMLQQSSFSDPAQSLKILQSVASLKQGGSEQIGGVHTTRYDGAIDPQKLASRYGSQGASLLRLYKQMGVTEIPISVWIGDDGYVHRVHMTFAAKTDASGSTSFDITMNLSKFGEAVDVKAPPKAEIAALADLMKSGGNG